MTKLDLSIIIVSWQVKDLLKDCLNSIFKETKTISFEVIVVDNASTDNTSELVAEVFPKVIIISNLYNRGFAKAVNQCLRQARGRYLLLLNPDTLIIDQAIEKMVAWMDQQPAVGISGCRLLNADQTIQSSVRRFPTFADHLLMMFKLHKLFPLKKYLAVDFNYQQEQEVEQLMGAFFLISRELMKKIGLFDEKFFIWFEEVDYCQRAKQAGYKVVYTPIAQIIHYGGQSFAQTAKLISQWRFSRSRLRYLRKHQPLLIYLAILLLTPLSLFLSLIYSLISPRTTFVTQSNIV